MTERFLRGLKPGENVEWTDTGQRLRGVVLVLRQLKRSLVWTLRYKAGGRRRRHDIGDYPLVSLDEARAKQIEVARKLREGDDPQAEREARLQIPTFSAGLKAYLDHIRSPHPNREGPRLRTWGEYARVLGGREEGGEIIVDGGSYTPADWLHLRLDALTSRDILRASRDILQERGDTTANRWQRYLSSMMTFCIQSGWLTHHPARGLKLQGTESASTDRLAWGDLVRIWRVCEEAHAGKIQVAWPVPWIVQGLILSGQRPVMLLRARWEDFETEGWWRFRVDQTKQERAHLVHVGHAAAAAWVRRIPRAHDQIVFPTTDGKVYKSHRSISNEIRKLRDVSGVDWSAKIFRPTAATLMLEDLDISLEEISLALGHQAIPGAAPVTRKHYTNTAEFRGKMQRVFEPYHDHLFRLANAELIKLGG